MKQTSLIVFGVAALAFGIVAVALSDRLWQLVLDVIGSKKAPTMIPRNHVILSIRVGGVSAIIIGAFVLWMSWRNR